MSSKLSFPVYASCYLTDLNRCLRPTVFMDFAQDAATRAAEKGGFDDAKLKSSGGVWIVARMITRFRRRVFFREELRLDTWHKGLDGVFFIRDYQLLDSNGESVVDSRSSWVVMDINKRCLLRSEELKGIIPTESQCEDNALAQSCPKIVIPKGVAKELIDTHIVKWSDVDYNAHANNVKYTLWALDALPRNLVQDSFLKESCINFNKEIPPGSAVELYHAYSNGYHYVEGLVDSQQCFITRLLFE